MLLSTPYLSVDNVGMDQIMQLPSQRSRYYFEKTVFLLHLISNTC
jgi:hypothetical protein